MISLIFKLLLAFLLFSTLNAKETKVLEKVSLQLQWLDQFQFAGYYLAKEKGFYKDVGLEVELKKIDYALNPVEEVLSRRATYGIGRSSLIIDADKGKKIKLLAAIFQSSPLVYITKKDSNITTIEEFKDKRVMLSMDTSLSVDIHAMLNQAKLNMSDVKEIEHTFKLDDLINNATDIMASYISNEPFLLEQKGIKNIIFDPKDYGFDFYSDIIFTSENEVKNHQERTLRFQNASLKGWAYAFSHIEESVDLILKKYNSQNKSKEALIYEAKELKKLAYYTTHELGHIDANKIQRIYDLYNVMGLTKNYLKPSSFIFHKDTYREVGITQKEQEYLDSKTAIKVCVHQDYFPFTFYEEGKFKGISVEFLNLISQKTDINFQMVKSKSMDEYLRSLNSEKCDLIPAIFSQENQIPSIAPTKNYIYDNFVLVTKINKPYISDLRELKDKKVLIRKGMKNMTHYVSSLYPNINLIQSDTNDLQRVASGEFYGYIGPSMQITNQISSMYFNELKIMSKIGEKKIGGAMGVNVENAILLNILNKAISSISERETKKITNSWLKFKGEKEIDYELIYILSALFSTLILAILYRQRILEKHSRELEKSQKALIIAQNNFNLGQEIANIGIWSLDYKTDKLEWSDGVHKIFGTDSKKFGASFEAFVKFVHPDDRDELNNTYINSIKKKTDYFLEHRIITLGGDVRYVEERCQNFFDENGHIYKSLGTVLDITMRRKVENALEELNVKLEERVLHELEKNRQKEQLLLQQSRMAQMGEMISMIAHQWRQPLGSISSTVVNLKLKLELEKFDLNSADGVNEAKEYFLQRLFKIENYVHNLSNTIDDFRNFYKPNKLSKTITLKKLVNKSLEIIGASLENDHIEIVTEFTDTQELDIYDNEVMQVLLNLLKNAQDNFKEKEASSRNIVNKIIIKTTNSTLSICDNGGGINDNIINKIFDPYFSTKDEKNGTGLGLYMSKTIVEEHHNAKLEVMNTEDGVCFKIKFKAQLSN